MQILRFPDTEKLTLNVGYVDLGKIDLLVREGFYSNRSDFIRTAIRNQLSVQSAELERVVVRHTFDVGLRDFSRAELEAKRLTGELAAATIESITVLGTLQASPEVKSALAGRVH